ncbi:phosphopantetheine-binding protein [Mucilaginibacter sp. UR6-11]|uniref:phosphopantetheine-binding protein n=1 Tax=Mucilaginibacter sp. UR6-11 TaxID=1435644 RepID=UPI001E5A832B|nr:phosphopantetheine-binding protein [Mucilaginibacter sp. UR6-11]MCC8424866.1 phosphopantetheine-binding protein [Mucilaginibacter sp. UR6-11]
MKTEEFIVQLHEELELEVPLNEDTNLKDLEEWDSMAAMIVIGFVSNNFNVILNANDIQNITTISSLIDRVGRDKFN